MSSMVWPIGEVKSSAKVYYRDWKRCCDLTNVINTYRDCAIRAEAKYVDHGNKAK